MLISTSVFFFVWFIGLIALTLSHTHTHFFSKVLAFIGLVVENWLKQCVAITLFHWLRENATHNSANAFPLHLMFSGDINEKLFSIIQSEEPHGHLKACCTSAPYLLKEGAQFLCDIWVFPLRKLLLLKIHLKDWVALFRTEWCYHANRLCVQFSVWDSELLLY